MSNTPKDNFLSWLKLILSATTYRIDGGLDGVTLLSAVLGGPDPKTIGYDISLQQSKPEETPTTCNKLTLTVSADVFDSSNTETIIAAILAARGVTSVRVHFPEALDYQEEEYNFTAKFLTEDDLGEDRRFLTAELIKKWSVIPLNRVGNQLFIAATNPHNKMADDIRMATGYDRITIYRISWNDYVRFEQFILPA
jgi:hypothetical protein